MSDLAENQEQDAEVYLYADDLQEAEVYLFSVDLQVQIREFKGQISGTTKSALTINCNSAQEFKSQLWLKINDKLKREVVFDDNDPRWNENISPSEEDLGRFILFYDCKAKRSLGLDKLNEITLSHWRTKEIWLYIHVYSLSVSNLTLWKKVIKSLIEPLNRDRAGASTFSEVNVLVAELKDKHRLHYQSNHINWIMWANRIQGSEPHLREKLISSPPPADMLHLFALARTAADDTIIEVRQNLCMAENVNENVGTGLARVRSLFDNVVQRQSVIFELQTEQQTQIDLINQELKAMEIQATTTRSLLNSMEQAVPAVETDFGRQIFSQIQDQEDIDHMET